MPVMNQIPILDTRLDLKFPRGTKAHVHNSWPSPEQKSVLAVFGSEGMLVYGEQAQTVTRHKISVSIQDLQNQDVGSSLVYEGAGQPLAPEMQRFIDCATTGERPKTDGWSLLDAVRSRKRPAQWR